MEIARIYHIIIYELIRKEADKRKKELGKECQV